MDVNGRESSYGGVKCEATKGSILGPLLFTIYMNDIVQSVTRDLFLYMDDSALVISGKARREIELRLRKELASLSFGWKKINVHFTWAKLKASYLPQRKD